MDIDNVTFKRQLLSILKHIANATFVTFDLEMSGITTRRQNGTGDRSQNVGKPTLQECYDDMKDAAETYQVVQVGITCVEEDHDKEYYLARPFNFYLSPLQASGADIRLERNFTFSSAACDFLLKHRFDFGAMMESGVPYLSRQEEDEYKEEYRVRADRASTIPDLVIPATDTENLDFYRKARQTIWEWVDNPKPKFDFVNIGSVLNQTSGYHRRLVHQLVRNEFPGYRCFPRGGKEFMQVTKIDLKREAEFQKKKDANFDAAIAKQIGLRWIFEALSGGDLSGIDPRWFYSESKDGDETKPELQLGAIMEDLARVKKALRHKNHVIVGHNLFTDLGFLFRTFVGLLPSKVAHFQQEINFLFPTVFDTKYVATHGQDYVNQASSLPQLLEPFKKVHAPLVVLHEKHNGYASAFCKEHEAGFDSWMTAELFVKLTSKLYEDKKEALIVSDSGDSSNYVDDEEGGAPLNVPDTGGGFLFGSGSTGEAPLPPAKHAFQSNRFSVLADVNDKTAIPVATPTMPAFMPPMKSSFWNAYVNKLRVTAAEGGVCDLAEYRDSSYDVQAED